MRSRGVNTTPPPPFCSKCILKTMEFGIFFQPGQLLFPLFLGFFPQLIKVNLILCKLKPLRLKAAHLPFKPVFLLKISYSSRHKRRNRAICYMQVAFLRAYAQHQMVIILFILVVWDLLKTKTYLVNYIFFLTKRPPFFPKILFSPL